MNFRRQQQQLQQIVNARAREARRTDHFDFAAPFLHEHAVRREIAENSLLIAVGQIDFVEPRQ